MQTTLRDTEAENGTVRKCLALLGILREAGRLLIKNGGRR
jgi:hypothetical protein